MAMLASRSQFPVGAGTASNYRSYAAASTVFASPTESEFSESYENSESVRSWDELRVGDWLRSINCAQYVDLFQQHNINGENLMDLDQATLKELGVTKVGDRVRINTQAKLFRSNAARRSSKRTVNRHSLAVLDNATPTPSTAASPRALHSARGGSTPRADKRLSRHYDSSAISTAGSSRPGSPMIDSDRTLRTSKTGFVSPPDSGKRENYASGKTSAKSEAGRFPSHVKGSPSLDNLASYTAVLPVDKPLIRAVFDSGHSSVVDITGCKAAHEIISKTLRKALINDHYKGYGFWLLEGSDPNATKCRRLGDTELVRIAHDRVRSERGRLMLRKLSAGEPEGEQLKVAAKFAENDVASPPGFDGHASGKSKSQMKVEKLIGESLPSATYPMSPASEHKTKAYFEDSLTRSESSSTSASARARKLKAFYGQRPPTELITQDLTTYFPEVEKEKMDKTLRMTIRRSQRLSRAASRMSVASNLSFASTLRDAPPLPTIADAWLQPQGTRRPNSTLRLSRPPSDYRDSIRESVAFPALEPLNENATLDSSRKSYVSFGDGSGSDSSGTNVNIPNIVDADGNSVMRSFLDDSGAVGDGAESINSRLSRFIAEDSETDDDELMEHLEQDSWENLKYMKGALIGQGSFGTVYLAFHAITGQMMALKQVEMPSLENTAIDAKKNTMVEALKREIDLLRELKHKNIVQYLGSNSDDTHLNIFLEYVPGGSVASILNSYGSLSEPLISKFVFQILQGLAYLHSRDIIHRDIKGANILIDHYGNVKISDFGISKRVESTLRNSVANPKSRGVQRVSLQGSVFWMAPEVVKQTAYTRKADIWSLGCLMIEMMTGSHPHPNCSQLQAIFKIGGSGEARPEVPQSASKEIRAFLERTFEIEHEKRPSAEELLSFAFVEDKARQDAKLPSG